MLCYRTMIVIKSPREDKILHIKISKVYVSPIQ